MQLNIDVNQPQKHEMRQSLILTLYPAQNCCDGCVVATDEDDVSGGGV